jgi:hypothetical protein
MSDATLYTERGLPRRSAKEKATGTIEQIQVKKIPIIEGEIRKKRAYNRKSDNNNTNKKVNSPRNNNKRHKKADPEDEPKPKKRKIYKNSEDKPPAVRDYNRGVWCYNIWEYYDEIILKNRTVHWVLFALQFVRTRLLRVLFSRRGDN